MATTISSFLAAGTRIFWQCQQCGHSGDVDLPALIAARGPDLDLTDRHPPCRTPCCGYWVGFYAQDGQRTRALSTPAGFEAESDRRTAWLRSAPRSPTPPQGGADPLVQGDQDQAADRQNQHRRRNPPLAGRHAAAVHHEGKELVHGAATSAGRNS